MTPLVGQITLGVYAVLLAAGGMMGFAKARSKPSLIAGLNSSLVAVVALLISAPRPMLGFGLGALLALALSIMFGVRLNKTRKFMPSGMLLIVSLIVLAIQAAVLARLGQAG